ncbi:Transmembrane domain-containing protein [Spironucleus salmonicida]|uniref:Transmembrane domain-containing protein n=1 Tax=Spironucleus salmonicida TaxID=348837 RepID=V6LZI8_9EUKA|nr:Transmembrane domain-containing protein [Spironucleus salmonicida]|eukprot:EST46249.1 Transmembrane domain-containing protein [Spironucleus salmonicida]
MGSKQILSTFTKQLLLTLQRKQSCHSLFEQSNNSVLISLFVQIFQVILVIALSITVASSNIDGYRGYPISTTYTYFLFMFNVTIMLSAQLAFFNKTSLGFYLDLSLFVLAFIHFVVYLYGYSLTYLILMSIFFILALVRFIFGICYEVYKAKQSSQQQRLI